MTARPAAGPPVPIEDELTAVLRGPAGPRPGLAPEGIPELRQAAALGRADPEVLGPVEDRVVPWRPEVTLLVRRPRRPGGPVLYHVHGGGMVAGDRWCLPSDVLVWAERFGALLVSVEYRLAPEHPHPVPVEDAYAGLAWTAAHAAELGGDPGKLVVAGASAGGGIAAALALMARNRGGPRLAGQVLLSPMLDDRNDTPSSHQMAGRGLWDRTANATGWSALLGDRRGRPGVPPYAAPARARDLSGLPPAYLDVGAAETFRDEAVAYATGLWQAGGQAELHVWPGAFHGFDELVPGAAVSRDAKRARVAWLERLLGLRTRGG
ncbi:alpha/beta hydrolase [Streptomyces capparidis]